MTTGAGRSRCGGGERKEAKQNRRESTGSTRGTCGAERDGPAPHVFVHARQSAVRRAGVHGILVHVAAATASASSSQGIIVLTLASNEVDPADQMHM